MNKLGFAPSCNYECGAYEQTADHIISVIPAHRAPNGRRGESILNEDTRYWVKNITVIFLMKQTMTIELRSNNLVSNTST